MPNGFVNLFVNGLVRPLGNVGRAGRPVGTTLGREGRPVGMVKKLLEVVVEGLGVVIVVGVSDVAGLTDPVTVVWV